MTFKDFINTELESATASQALLQLKQKDLAHMAELEASLGVDNGTTYINSKFCSIFFDTIADWIGLDLFNDDTHTSFGTY